MHCGVDDLGIVLPFGSKRLSMRPHLLFVYDEYPPFTLPMWETAQTPSESTFVTETIIRRLRPRASIAGTLLSSIATSPGNALGQWWAATGAGAGRPRTEGTGHRDCRFTKLRPVSERIGHRRSCHSRTGP